MKNKIIIIAFLSFFLSGCYVHHATKTYEGSRYDYYYKCVNNNNNTYSCKSKLYKNDTLFLKRKKVMKDCGFKHESISYQYYFNQTKELYVISFLKDSTGKQIYFGDCKGRSVKYKNRIKNINFFIDTFNCNDTILNRLSPKEMPYLPH